MNANRTRFRTRMDPLIVLFAVAGAILLTFLALPIVATVARGDPGKIAAAYGEREVRSAIATSFGAALVATALSCLLGIPLAYVLARVEFWGKGVTQSIIDLPVVIPHTISGIALLVVFGRMGLFSEPMSALELPFEDHVLGIVLAMMFVSCSFVVNASREGFEAVDERLENVARSLGATRGEAFLTVTIPLSASSIITGAVMAWARAVSEFGAVVIIAFFPRVIPTLIYEKNLHGGLSDSMPVAALLIIVCVSIFVVTRTATAIWKRRQEEPQ